jgi:hypothetical protein
LNWIAPADIRKQDDLNTIGALLTIQGMETDYVDRCLALYALGLRRPVPPIVILAACESSAIAETHNTPANGWLALGARAVLGTYFPVDANLTLMLISRLLANLAEAINGRQFLPTWELVVFKTLALNRYLDFLYAFDESLSRKGLRRTPGEFILEYTFQWNQRPERDPDELYRLCPEIMISALRRFSAELVDEFRNFLAAGKIVPHTMFFTHLGSPESILLRKAARRSSPSSPAQDYWRARLRETRTPSGRADH